ncbi:MAG TPA: outer membrane lipoprotein carrier protein LolA [Bacteroidia bacterium]|nr:outer membrane lipoprotein carrier protein LolA [Bacteroidia bacterium]
MKKIFLFIVLCSFAIMMQAQEETADPKAKAILESLSKKTKTYKTIKAEFTVISYDKDKKPTDTQKGSLIVKGGKYKMDIKNQTVICDSTTTWTFLKDANEVQISNVDANADKGSVSPTNIFTIYEKGFKSHFESEANNMDVIDLYPKHPEREQYHTLKLTINKEKNQITEVIVLKKDGSTMKYMISSFITNSEIPGSTFIFNAKDYPGVEVEDLRN